MSFQHSSVYIVRVVDVDGSGEHSSWFVGPYGSTRAAQTADELERSARDTSLRSRECHVEPLFSDAECLRVADYGRAEQGSLQ